MSCFNYNDIKKSYYYLILMSKNSKIGSAKFKILNEYPNYKISEKGNVLRIRDNYIMTKSIRCGYYMVSLTKNGKTKQIFVHQLVARTFIKNTTKLPCVDHIDNNRFNNSVLNLR